MSTIDKQLNEASKDYKNKDVRSLLSQGANPNWQNFGGWTALIWAAVRGYTETVQVLLSYGADVNMMNDWDQTALIFAAQYGHIEIVHALLSHGAEINLKDIDGRTALHGAAVKGSIEIVHVLLIHGANVNYKNNDGKTAYDVAPKQEIKDAINNAPKTREGGIKTRLRVEKETRDKIGKEKETRDKFEKETRERLEYQRVEGEKVLLDEIKQLKLEKQQLEQELEQQKKLSHVFLSTPSMQQLLPSYLNASTLEVNINEYIIVDSKEIGKGSFASVYKGIHTISQREVVIKKINGAASNSNNEKKFAAELLKIRFLVHPGIPKVEAFYRSDIDMCVVFQESNGMSVRHVMDENERMKKIIPILPSLIPSDLLRLTIRSIEILDYVHSTGVVHYDIKPENILLCNSEYGVQLIDFGSAGFVSNTANTSNASTLSYSSPEKLNPLVMDDIKSNNNKMNMTKLDVWSLGATILNACCNVVLITDDYDDNDDVSPYFSITSLSKGLIKLDATNDGEQKIIPWDLEFVLSKYFEICNEAKVIWDTMVDTDIKDIIKVCLTHDISKRPFIRDITQMPSYQRLRNKM